MRPTQLRCPHALAVLALSFLVACGATDSDASAPKSFSTSIATDGDTVVARSTGTLPDSGTHQLTQVWRIGDADGLDSTLTFGQINGFAVHSDGTVAVFDGSGPSLRLYNEQGQYVRSLGRKGAGPGEFTQANGIAFLDDGRLAFWDPPTSRITVYGMDGTNTSWTPPVTGMWMNNALLPAAGYAFSLQAPIRDSSIERANGLIVSRTGYFLYDTSGTVVDTIIIPLADREPARLVASSERMVSMSSVPFSPDQSVTVLSDGRHAIAFGDRYVVRVLGGPQPLRIEREAAALPVDADEGAEQRAQTEHGMRRVDPAWRWDGPGIPDSKPLITSLEASDDGRLWVRVSAPSERIPEDERAEPRPTDPDGPPPPPVTTWREPAWFDVYEGDGTLLGRVVMPPRSTLLGSRGDLVWGVTRDELDVPYLTQWRVTPSLTAAVKQ